MFCVWQCFEYAATRLGFCQQTMILAGWIVACHHFMTKSVKITSTTGKNRRFYLFKNLNIIVFWSIPIIWAILRHIFNPGLLRKAKIQCSKLCLVLQISSVAQLSYFISLVNIVITVVLPFKISCVKLTCMFCSVTTLQFQVAVSISNILPAVGV